MNLIENFKTAIANISGYKMRSILTMLGIIIGISSVIMINSTGEGVKNSIFNAMDSINSSMIQVYPRTVTSESDYLTYNDAQALLQMDMVDRVSLLMEGYGFEIERRDGSIKTGTVGGFDDNLVILEEPDVAVGRFLSAEDVYTRSRVVVLQAETSFEVFGRFNSVGEKITIETYSEREEFTVIGVLREVEGGMVANNINTPLSRSMAIIPYTAMQDLWGIDYVDFFGITLTPGHNSVEAASVIASFLDRVKGTEERYIVESLEVAFDQVDMIFSAVTGFVALVAGISLFVGGVGVMNIMLVTVKERTREIGIRKSLGATNSNIRLQFVLESIILCFIGGIIGIVLGVLSAMGIGALLSGLMGSVVTPTVGAFDLSFAFIISSVVGVVFGVYPAGKAAKLDPIEALRYE